MNTLTGSKRILVVDDDPDCRELIKNILTDADYTIETAVNGAECLNRLNSKADAPIDLIILDLMLPDVSGYSILQKLQDEAKSSPPVLILTARSMDFGTEEMIRADENVREMCRKPFDITEFSRQVVSIVQ